MNDINYFGKTNHRQKYRKFGIKENDRFSHTYIVGKTGVGKTTLLKTKILQDIQNGKGIAVFDPHGDLAESIINQIPSSRKHDLIYLDTPNADLNLRYNPLKRVSKEKRPLVASGLLEIFEKLFKSAWGVRLEHILRHAILTLLDQPDATIQDIHRIMVDRHFRGKCIEHIENDALRQFWLHEFKNYTESSITPVLNKVGAFIANPVIKQVLVDNSEDISFRRIMDTNKILIINLSKGRIGSDASNLLGSLFLTSLGLAAFSRQDTAESRRLPFFIFVDEFQNFTTSFLVNALSELRKYRIGLILANQYLEQIRKEIRDGVLGNVGTLIVFRTGAADAQHLSKELDGLFSAGDISNLPNYRFYIRLMIDSGLSKPFSARTIEHITSYSIDDSHE